jgi:uncharacterized protein (TIGR01777 family)
MRVALTGATGTIGRALAQALAANGDEVIALSRDQHRARATLGEGVEVHTWPDPAHTPPPEAALAGADAVVHLLGEPVAQRWTARAKREIRESRVLSTRSLVAALTALPDGRRPRTLVSQSAIGYYGPRDDEPVDEQAPPGQDFLAAIVAEWEREALEAAPSMRVVLTRTGVVLSPKGGALAKMLPPFRLGVGGPVAGGRQFVPWIHLDDVVGALRFCVEQPDANGPLNLTAPEPVSNRELSRALGRALHRPAVVPVPRLAVRLLYGDMAEIVTTGQRAIPAALQRLGYEFRHPELDAALRDVLARAKA